MKAWTDYPFTRLGDEPFKEAPVREVEVLTYDGDKYCTVMIEGDRFDVKRGYLYQSPGCFGEVPVITDQQLKGVSRC